MFCSQNNHFIILFKRKKKFFCSVSSICVTTSTFVTIFAKNIVKKLEQNKIIFANSSCYQINKIKFTLFGFEVYRRSLV